MKSKKYIANKSSNINEKQNYKTKKSDKKKIKIKIKLKKYCQNIPQML